MGKKGELTDRWLTRTWA